MDDWLIGLFYRLVNYVNFFPQAFFPISNIYETYLQLLNLSNTACTLQINHLIPLYILSQMNFPDFSIIKIQQIRLRISLQK